MKLWITFLLCFCVNHAYAAKKELPLVVRCEFRDEYYFDIEFDWGKEAVFIDKIPVVLTYKEVTDKQFTFKGNYTSAYEREYYVEASIQGRNVMYKIKRLDRGYSQEGVFRSNTVGGRRCFKVEE